MSPPARQPKPPGTEKRPSPPGPGDPEVLLDVERGEGCLHLVLANVGPVTAFDVNVAFDRPLPGVGGEVDVAALRVFQHLPFLRAGKEIRVFLDTVSALLARRRPRKFAARVTYRSRDGRHLGETFRHDLRIWADWGEVRRQ